MQKIIIVIVAVPLIATAFPCFNYLITRVLWENVFDLKYEETFSSYGKNEDGKQEFLGWKYALTNTTDNTYELEYIYVYVEPIITNGKIVKIKIYQTANPNSSIEIEILFVNKGVMFCAEIKGIFRHIGYQLFIARGCA